LWIHIAVLLKKRKSDHKLPNLQFEFVNSKFWRFSLSMTLFPDMRVWRESSQWKAVFGPTVIGNTTSQLFANFGSMGESLPARTDISSIAARITEQFAMDVYTELRNNIPTQFRSSRTSQGNREVAARSLPPSRTPVVTPHNSKRVQRATHG
jgi:hypothetical protein